MKKETIVQFICFETSSETEDFIIQWEHYNSLVSTRQVVTLQQGIEESNRFRYVSQHRGHSGNFQFVFKKGRRSPRSPEAEMKIKETGGYIPLQTGWSHPTAAGEIKVLVFLDAVDADIPGYKKLPEYLHLNIYQSYYENCNHAYILEYFVKQIHADSLLTLIKQHPHATETGLYKECVFSGMKMKPTAIPVAKQFL